MLKEQTAVLILGGWSPGPLNYLKYGRRNCIFLEPKIPTPPMGWSWCWDWSVVCFFAVLVTMIWSTHAVGPILAAQHTQATVILTQIGLVLFSLLLLRLCLAWIVRSSIRRGVRLAKSYLNDVTVVIGFSWGAGILAELVRLELVGKPTQASALLICPTSTVMAQLALQRDPALGIREAQHVHVYHGRYDGFFCPNADRWEQAAGVTLHWCEDNHVMMKKESIQAMTETLDELVQHSKRLHCY